MQKFEDAQQLSAFMVNNGFRGVEIKGDNWVMCCCPFHNDTHPSFGLNVLTLVGHCFKCGWFKWDEILTEMGIAVDADLDNVDAMTGLSWRAMKDKLDFKDKDKERFKRFQLPHKSLPIENAGKPSHHYYMLERGFNSEWLRSFDVQVCIDKNSKYYDRIILPVNDVQGRLVFFDARTIENGKKDKYIRPSGSPIKYCLGGIDKLYSSGCDKVVIVEGYMDMMKLWQLDIPAVCTFGTTLHLPQLKMILKKHIDFIILGQDNDEAGNKAAKEAKKKLDGCGSRIYRLNFGSKKDPGEFKDQRDFYNCNKFILKLS